MSIGVRRYSVSRRRTPHAAALRGIAQATEPQALSVLLVPVPVGHLQEQAVRRAVVDAFCIYTMPEGQPVIDIALCRNAPVVFVDGPELANHPFVGTDEHAADAISPST